MSSFKSLRKKSKNRSNRSYLGGSFFIADHFCLAFSKFIRHYVPGVRPILIGSAFLPSLFDMIE